jgi:F-type H+-transporting ATPase subunit b
MIKIVTLLMLVSTAAFASGGGESDIVARTINFVIFAAGMYYLIGDKVKAFFVDRSESIQADLKKVQDRVAQTKLAKQNGEKKVDEAKKIAADFLATSKKEGVLLNERINEQMLQDLKSLESQQASLITFEQREMVSSVVEEMMGDILSDENIPLDNDVITDIMLKKVA